MSFQKPLADGVIYYAEAASDSDLGISGAIKTYSGIVGYGNKNKLVVNADGSINVQSTVSGSSVTSVQPSSGAVFNVAQVSGTQLSVKLADALSQALDSMLTYPRGTDYSRRTSSANILANAGKLAGVFVAQASATPTITVYDSATTTTTTVVVPTFTPVAGQMYNFRDIRVQNGLYVAISGTVDCTVMYDPTTT